MTNLPKSWGIGFRYAELASTFSNGESLGRKLGAALMSGNRLLSLGANIYNKTSPQSAWNSVHAECAALIKRKYYDGDKNLTLYVYRSRLTAPNKGNIVPACSKPCLNCMTALRMASVRRVRFLDENGLPQELKL